MFNLYHLFTPGKSTSEKTASEKTVPNVLNFIWLGSYPSQTTLERLSTVSTLNPGYKIILWVDNAFLNEKEKVELLAFATLTKIEIKEAQELCGQTEFKEKFPIYHEMRDYEMNRMNIEMPFEKIAKLNEMLRASTAIARERNKALGVETIFHDVHCVGSYPKDETLKRLSDLKNENPADQVVLHIDSYFLNASEKIKIEAFCKEKDIHINYANANLHYEAMCGNYSDAHKLRNEILATQGVPFVYFVAMSDILRLWVLHKMGGGHYLDDDDVAHKPFPLNVNLPEGFAVCMPGGNHMTSNSILSAVPNSSILSEYMNSISDNYKLIRLQYTRLGPLIGDFLQSSPTDKLRDIIGHHKCLIAMISGPFMLNNLLCPKASIESSYQSLGTFLNNPSASNWAAVCMDIFYKVAQGYYDPLSHGDAQQFNSPLTACIEAYDDGRYTRSFKI